MHIFSLAFLCGVVLLQQLTFLPEKFWGGIFLLFSLILIRINKKYLTISAIGLGFTWSLFFAHHQMNWSLPKELEGKNQIISGVVASIPNKNELGTSFLFKTANTLLQLTWHNNKTYLQPGQEWQFTVRLKRIHGNLNPGGFDYEAHALEEGIRARGYVVNHTPAKLLSNHWYHYSLNRIRQLIKEKIENSLPSTNTSPWIVALVTGERHNISQENWDVLRNTGTNHLMAIAGLHIGFMASFAYLITAWSWRRFRLLTLTFPTQLIGTLSALATAIIYGALAGFSIPTQRACLMLTVFLIFVLLRRVTLSWHAWSLALLLVLFINPLTVLSESFWLSFGAVALIIYGVSGRLNGEGLWWKWGRIQWVIGIGLIPLSMRLFQQFSLISFIANSIAIPWVGFFIVPLSLFGSFILFFSTTYGTYILVGADKLMAILWQLLSYFSHLSWSSWYQVVPNFGVLIIACLGIIVLLVPVGFPGRFFGIIGLLPLLWYHAPTPKMGEMWLTLLDVGQGLSAVVQTQQHLLIFDTGAKSGINFDMGESVVTPFLHTLSIKKIDMLVISHGDNDHSGGSATLLKKFNVLSLKTSVPEKFNFKNTSYCLSGENWNWDGVTFEFLYPTLSTLGLNNDSSCVLKVTANKQSILLTGDIEKFAENVLLDTQRAQLASNILIAPHHGSKTSGVDEFIKTVNPRYVLFPIGYRNRYHFPHKSILEKYNAIGTKQFDSANAGAITIKGEDISLFRSTHHHYWNF